MDNECLAVQGVGNINSKYLLINTIYHNNLTPINEYEGKLLMNVFSLFGKKLFEETYITASIVNGKELKPNKTNAFKDYERLLKTIELMPNLTTLIIFSDFYNRFINEDGVINLPALEDINKKKNVTILRTLNVIALPTLDAVLKSDLSVGSKKYVIYSKLKPLFGE